MSFRCGFCFDQALRRQEAHHHEDDYHLCTSDDGEFTILVLKPAAVW